MDETSKSTANLAMVLRNLPLTDREFDEFCFIDCTREAILGELFLLTMKPRLYVANVGEDALAAASELVAGSLLRQMAPSGISRTITRSATATFCKASN